MNKLTKKKNVSRTKSRKNVSKSMKNMRGGEKWWNKFTQKFRKNPIYNTIKTKPIIYIEQKPLPPPPSLQGLHKLVSLAKNQYKYEKQHQTANSYAQQALEKLNLPNSNSNKKTYEIYPNLYQKALTIITYNPKNLDINPKHIENARQYILRGLNEHEKKSKNEIINLFIQKAKTIAANRTSRGYSQLSAENEIKAIQELKPQITTNIKTTPEKSIYSSLASIKSQEQSEYEDSRQFIIQSKNTKIEPGQVKHENPYVNMSGLRQP